MEKIIIILLAVLMLLCLMHQTKKRGRELEEEIRLLEEKIRLKKMLFQVNQKWKPFKDDLDKNIIEQTKEDWNKMITVIDKKPFCITVMITVIDKKPFCPIPSDENIEQTKEDWNKMITVMFMDDIDEMVKVMEKIKVMEKTNLEQTKDEWGEMAESAWDAAWNVATSWTHQDDDNHGDSEEPSMASVREAFSEASRTVARIVDATAKEAMKTANAVAHGVANAVAHGVAKGVARFMDGMDENLQLLINATKDDTSLY
jgi:cell division protein ZapA (FtsZ GTPase activity inhibitor)